MKKLLLALSIVATTFAVTNPTLAESPERLAPTPATPAGCWTQADRTTSPDRFRGACGGGTGTFQVEGVCYFYDGGPYVVGQSSWYRTPYTTPWFRCPSSHPVLYRVRIDFTWPFADNYDTVFVDAIDRHTERLNPDVTTGCYGTVDKRYAVDYVYYSSCRGPGFLQITMQCINRFTGTAITKQATWQFGSGTYSVSYRCTSANPEYSWHYARKY